MPAIFKHAPQLVALISSTEGLSLLRIELYILVLFLPFGDADAHTTITTMTTRTACLPKVPFGNVVWARVKLSMLQVATNTPLDGCAELCACTFSARRLRYKFSEALDKNKLHQQQRGQRHTCRCLDTGFKINTSLANSKGAKQKTCDSLLNCSFHRVCTDTPRFALIFPLSSRTNAPCA